MTSLIIAFILWSMLVGSLWLSVWGLRRRSFVPMAWAALLSFVFSLVTGFSIGSFVLVLPLLQVAAAVALLLRARWSGWLLLLVAAVALYFYGTWVRWPW